jgi:hypothetical protein
VVAVRIGSETCVFVTRLDVLTIETMTVVVFLGIRHCRYICTDVSKKPTALTLHFSILLHVVCLAYSW